jgi:hypothetical protein
MLPLQGVRVRIFSRFHVHRSQTPLSSRFPSFLERFTISSNCSACAPQPIIPIWMRSLAPRIRA